MPTWRAPPATRSSSCSTTTTTTSRPARSARSAKALANANRRLYHQRGRLGIPRRAGVSIIAMAIRGREAHVAKLGPAAAVILREERMYELPPPPAVDEEDPRVRAAPRGGHAGRGAGDHALHLEGRAGARRPDGAGQPQPGPGGGRGRAEARPGHPAPVGRGGARGAALPDPRRLGLGRDPGHRDHGAAGHRHHPPARAGAPVRSRWPGCRTRARCRWPMRSGASCIAWATPSTGCRRPLGRAILYAFNVLFAFVPRRRPQYPRQILRTAAVRGGSPPAAGDAGHGRRGAAAGVRHQRGQPARRVADAGHPARHGRPRRRSRRRTP